MVAKIKQNIYEDDPGFNPDLEIEGVGYSGKSGFDKAGLVADAIKNCVKKRGEEMHQGYKSSIVDKFGNVYVKIVPDTRKEFIGSVIALTSLLRFEIKSYSEMEDKYTNFKKTKEEILNKYIYKERKRSEEHTSELQSHSFISYAVFCLKKKKKRNRHKKRKTKRNIKSRN